MTDDADDEGFCESIGAGFEVAESSIVCSCVDCVAALGPVGGSFAAFAGVDAASDLSCSAGLLSSFLSAGAAVTSFELSGAATS